MPFSAFSQLIEQHIGFLFLFLQKAVLVLWLLGPYSWLLIPQRSDIVTTAEVVFFFSFLPKTLLFVHTSAIIINYSQGDLR